MSAVRGIEAIKVDLPPTNAKINTNVREEKCNQAPAATVPAMTSVERYRQEWTKLLNDLDGNFDRVRDLAFNGDLKVSKFRSVYWALLLRVLNADYRSWRDQRQQQRNLYEQLKQEFIKNPHDMKRPDDDPLSQSKQSVWNQYFSDQELFAVIKQDVIRTFPGVDFFRKDIIQSAMTNILFYYAREHPYMCYRQGMHEILAPILFVMFSDHQSLLHFKELAITEIDEILLDVLNPQYLEADSFSLFSRLMALIESYYRITNMTQTLDDYARIPVHADNTNGISTEVEVISQLNSIRDKILAKEDLHLHNYLLKLDIPLHIFGMYGLRWLRLLFGREFALLDLLMLWDAIFADSDHFDLPNYILVSMLIRIRDKLLMNDYTTCLTCLMRYPANVDIHLILRHALHMQMPKKFDRPPNAFIYVTMNPAVGPTTQTMNNNLSAVTNSSMQKGKVSFATNRIAAASALDSEMRQRQQRSRSTSLGSTNGSTIMHKIQEIQTRNAANSVAFAHMHLAPENHRINMDGYSEENSEFLRLQLKNAQTTISVTRNKLHKYLHVMRKNVITSNNTSTEMLQALQGIEELCTFLDIKSISPHQAHNTTTPIDPAFEANENQVQQKRKLRLGGKSNNSQQQQCNITNNIAESYIENPGTRIDEGEDSLANHSLLPPTSLMPVDSTATIFGTTYEKPDNGFMLSSKRILGNRREIELKPIAIDEHVERPTNSISNNAIQKLATLQKSVGLPIVDPLGQHEE